MSTIKNQTAVAEDQHQDNTPENKKVRFKTLVIHEGKYRTLLTKKYENRKKWIKPDPKLVHSYIPGTVTEIFIKEGDQVKKGEPMMVLEAMKMLNNIEVPMDGTIKKLNIKAKDRIPKGFLMIEFE